MTISGVKHLIKVTCTNCNSKDIEIISFKTSYFGKIICNKCNHETLVEIYIKPYATKK